MDTPEFTKDPMELEEGFFQRDEIADEEEFKNQFRENIDIAPKGLGEEQEEEEEEEIQFDNQGNPIVADEEDFKFDESLAESEKAELADLNKKLGTNFEDLASLKNAIRQQDTVEETNEIQKDRELVAYLEQLSNYSDEKIVEEDLKITYQREGKNIHSEEIKDEIESKIERMKDNETLTYAARTVRDGINSLKDSKNKNIKDFENKEIQTKEQSIAQLKEQTQNSINEIYKSGNFFGIKPDKQALLKAYADVTKNKHLDHLRANPSEAVEYALFKTYRTEILKKLGKPDYKAGVKSTLEELGMETSSQTGKQTIQSQESSQGKKSYFEQFIK